MKVRRGLISELISTYLTPINLLLFLTFFMVILVMAWFINVWWTVEQQKLTLVKSVQQGAISP